MWWHDTHVGAGFNGWKEKYQKAQCDQRNRPFWPFVDYCYYFGQHAPCGFAGAPPQHATYF